jgi:hypothetical protein
MLGRVRYIIYSTNMIRLRDLTCRGVMATYTTTGNSKYSYFLIRYIKVNKGVFCLIISYLRMKSYNVLNDTNCSTDWSFPLKFISIVTGSDRKYNKGWIFLTLKFNLISIIYIYIAINLRYITLENKYCNMIWYF